MNIDDLTQAVQALSQKGLLDYLQIILPIVLSAIAIWISIRTASKQNKIALFEKRMSVLNEIERITCFAESVEGISKRDNEAIINIYNSIFGVHLKSFSDTMLENFYARIKQSELCFSMTEFLFEEDYSKKMHFVIEALSNYMEKVLQYHSFDTEQSAFVEKTLAFKNNEYEILRKRTKL